MEPKKKKKTRLHLQNIPSLENQFALLHSFSFSRSLSHSLLHSFLYLSLVNMNQMVNIQINVLESFYTSKMGSKILSRLSKALVGSEKTAHRVDGYCNIRSLSSLGVSSPFPTTFHHQITLSTVSLQSKEGDLPSDSEEVTHSSKRKVETVFLSISQASPLASVCVDPPSSILESTVASISGDDSCLSVLVIVDSCGESSGSWMWSTDQMGPLVELQTSSNFLVHRTRSLLETSEYIIHLCEAISR